MQNFVDLADGKNALAFFSKGLREYEVEDDDKRTLKITLLRTQRAYMTAASPMIPDELNKYTGQHSLGKMEYEYAICPHTGDWKEANLFQKAYAFKTSIHAIKGVAYKGTLPVEASFIAISDTDNIMVSAVKQSEDGKGTIVRLYNLSDDEVKFDVSTILPVTKVEELKLNEDILRDVDFKNGKFEATLGAKKIATYKFIG